ncbi:unnamed protein product [Acidocella sp. C78]|nr:unnamed protein product [Acidocella sp. C78]
MRPLGRPDFSRCYGHPPCLNNHGGFGNRKRRRFGHDERGLRHRFGYRRGRGLVRRGLGFGFYFGVRFGGRGKRRRLGRRGLGRQIPDMPACGTPHGGG